MVLMSEVVKMVDMVVVMLEMVEGGGGAGHQEIDYQILSWI